MRSKVIWVPELWKGNRLPGQEGARDINKIRGVYVCVMINETLALHPAASKKHLPTFPNTSEDGKLFLCICQNTMFSAEAKHCNKQLRRVYFKRKYIASGDILGSLLMLFSQHVGSRPCISLGKGSEYSSLEKLAQEKCLQILTFGSPLMEWP